MEEMEEELSEDEFRDASLKRGAKYDEQIFVQLVGDVGKVLLDKSQAPDVKRRKREAASKISELMTKQTSDCYTPSQVIKKIANLRQRVKKKSDFKRTGNLPINLKPAENHFLELMQAKENPSITPLNFGVDVGLRKQDISAPIQSSTEPSIEPPIEVYEISSESNVDVEILDFTSSSSKTATKKSDNSSLKKAPVNVNDLQQTVLFSQLELVKKQECLFKAQEERQKELHAAQMEVLSLEKQLLLEKLSAHQLKTL